MTYCVYCMMLILLLTICGGNQLPQWLIDANIIGFVICMVASVICWEIHKSKIKELNERINKLEEFEYACRSNNIRTSEEESDD